MNQNKNNNRDADSAHASINLDPKKLSFSQAQGYEELPGQLKLGQLPDSARTQIWSLLFFHLEQSKRTKTGLRVRIDVSGDWERILENTHCFFDNLALDDWDPDFEKNRGELRRHIEQDEFNHLFDRLQFIMRHRNCPQDFIRDLNRIFRICNLAYTIDQGPPPTILPAATAEEAQALVESLQVLRQARLSGSTSHLEAASDCIRQRDWAGAVRESIHAVESVARTIAPSESRTLTPALKSIERKQGALHTDLKDGFVSFYHYASNLRNSRHGQPEGKTVSAGMDEALFMFGACASFASYLWRKHVAGAIS